MAHVNLYTHLKILDVWDMLLTDSCMATSMVCGRSPNLSESSSILSLCLCPNISLIEPLSPSSVSIHFFVTIGLISRHRSTLESNQCCSVQKIEVLFINHPKS
jgi:hypothetical protein